jgi:metallo-beta-lactamase family protein
MSLQLSFLGAARTVTGSSFLLRGPEATLLVDCGMFQGSKTLKELNYEPFPFEPSRLDALILTHAHIDHSGLTPKLDKAGFHGPIWATGPTVDLCSIMLPDSGHIQETEVENLNRRKQRRGEKPVAPIYTAEDARRAMRLFRPAPLRAWFTPARGFRARFWNAGHLLGSASVEIEAETGEGAPLRLMFSGDVGTGYKALQAAPEGANGFDYVVCESTYGDVDRMERGAAERRDILARETMRAAEAGGPLIVPAFAVERMQELVADFAWLMREGRIPQSPLIIDSPLAIAACDVFRKHADELVGGDELVRAFDSGLVRFSESVEESRAIGRLRGFFIVMAASGMADAGRIRHHLANHLWRPKATVLFVGYQAAGTLGRLLLDGETTVTIRGEQVRVRANIRMIDDYSGHADGPQLAAWVAARGPIRQDVFLTHGEDEARAALGRRIEGMAGGRIIDPDMDATFVLSTRGASGVGDKPAARLSSSAAARRDWHNDLSKLMLDIDDTIRAAPDEKARAVILRRLRRALEGEEREEPR